MDYTIWGHRELVVELQKRDATASIMRVNLETIREWAKAALNTADPLQWESALADINDLAQRKV
jgi:hypothetical protein